MSTFPAMLPERILPDMKGKKMLLTAKEQKRLEQQIKASNVASVMSSIWEKDRENEFSPNYINNRIAKIEKLESLLSGFKEIDEVINQEIAELTEDITTAIDNPTMDYAAREDLTYNRIRKVSLKNHGSSKSKGDFCKSSGVAQLSITPTDIKKAYGDKPVFVPTPKPKKSHKILVKVKS